MPIAGHDEEESARFVGSALLRVLRGEFFLFPKQNGRPEAPVLFDLKRDHMCEIIASPKAEQETSVAPSIRRAKS